MSLALDGNVLSAAGAAAADWIGDSVRVARALPGVTRFDPSRTIDASIRDLIATIDSSPVLFVKGTATFVTEGEWAMNRQVTRLRELDAFARAGDRRFLVELIGQADADGPPEMNLPFEPAPRRSRARRRRAAASRARDDVRQRRRQP